MSNIVIDIIMILSIILGIMYHEYGHLTSAKRNHIKVNAYCIGFGKPVWTHKGKDGVAYGIALLPLGGYCSIEDEELDKAPLHTYISVLLAGVIRNFILGTILLVIGQMIIAKGLVSPAVLLQNAMQCFCELISGLGDTIKEMLNLKTMASYGGFVSQMTETSSTISAASKTINHVIGMSLMMGGLMNYMLAIFNALPIPGIDGGQIIVRLICDFFKKVFHCEIEKRYIMLVNLVAIVLLSCYQGLILLFDIPWVQNFFLNL